ncbi:MAG: 4-(cytidine 5'-diphospho)-2-C-methyl-D-erythritol kinase [Gammaproteobacteria bacterium]
MQSWPAPAKLNLFLHVLGRRDDGYHLLQTVFQFLDYGDELTFTVRNDDQIRLTCNYDGIEPEQDLVIRSARLLQSKSDKPVGVDIAVQKRLPIGGGLGGGSSDAATTLMALNHIWGMRLSGKELSMIGLGLGADIPVFVKGVAAWAEGVGEQLSQVDLPERWFLVVYPGLGVATAEIFNSAYLTRHTPAITIRDFFAGAGRNDCEEAVRKAHPEVAALLDWLGSKTQARMTGTGSCVFAVFDTEDEARILLQQLPEPWQGFIAHGRNRSPLLDRMSREQSPR